MTIEQDGWSTTWLDRRRRIVECGDLNALPEGIAAWRVSLTGGTMPEAVAAGSALQIGRWIRSNRSCLEHERQRAAHGI